MLLSLLGACIVLGPFQGPEWEPVSGLLSKDHSCRNPQCYGNLLVLCLFLIWQVRHHWHQITRTHPSMKKINKVPPQKWAVPSIRSDTCFELNSKFLYRFGNFRGLGAHSQQWAQRKRWEYQRGLRASRARYLLSWRHRCWCPPWDFHTSSQSTFCTTSFSRTCVLHQNSSWDTWQGPWHLSDEHTHLICKPRLPDLNMYYQRMGQPLVYSQEELVPLEPAVSLSSHPTSMTSATVLPNLPSQRPQFCSCSKEFLPFPSNQQVGIHTWKSQDCPQEAWATRMENQIPGREPIRETQAPWWANQRQNSMEHAWEIKASGRQLPINFGLEDNAETKVLEWESQRIELRQSDEEILMPGWEIPGHMGVEHRAQIQELGKRNQRKARGENPQTQAHIVDNQEQLRCKIDAETETPGWGNQDKRRNEDAIETQVFEENKKEAQGEDEGETQEQGSGKQDQTGSENGEQLQVSWRGKQDKNGGDTGTGIQANERGNKDQVEGENVVPTQIPGRENLREIKQEDGAEIQALGWGKQEYIESENVTEIQAPGWEKQDQGRSKKAAGEIQKQLRHDFRVGGGRQGLERGKDAGETQISRKEHLREIREEDWVVIQTPWWEDQRPMASETDKEFEMLRWGNQDEIGSEQRAEVQAPGKRDQSKDRDEDGMDTLASEVENQGQLRGETQVDNHPPDKRNQEQFGNETSMDIQVSKIGNLSGVKGEGGKEAQEFGEENQGQLSNEINGKIQTPKWKIQEHIRSKDGADTQASDAKNWGELIIKFDGETCSAEWKKEEQAGGENGTGTWALGEENQNQLRGNIDRKTHLLEWKTQGQVEGENGTEIQAPGKRNQREPGNEDGAQTQRPERENLGLSDNGDGENHSPGKRNWRQSEGTNEAENQTLEKRNQREVGSEDGRAIQRLRRANPKLLKNKIHGKTRTSEWKNQEQIGGEKGAEIQIQGKRNMRGTASEDGRETQAPGGDYQEQFRGQIDREIQIQGQESHKKCDANAAKIWGVESQRRCIAEEAGEPGVPKGGIKDQVRERDAAKGNLPVDCSGLEGSPVLTGSGYGAMEQEQAVASTTCPEMKPLPHQGELFLPSSENGKHLASQSSAPARKRRAGISPASLQAPPKPQRSQQRDKIVNAGKASGLAWQLQRPQSLATSLNLPFSCPPASCGQAPQAAPALVGVPSALTVLPKWPILKKSQQQLLESLMQRKIAHLKWGLPQRTLESHLLFNLLDPAPLPFAGVQLPGLYTVCELQRLQKRLYETLGSRPGLKSTEKSQRIQPPKRKSSKLSSKLSTQARALEKFEPPRSEPMGVAIHPPKPPRVRSSGGSRERQDVQKEAPPRPPRVKRPAPRNPRPAAESGNWCGQERTREPSSGNSRDGKVIRPGISQAAERAPSRVRTSYSRAGHDHRRQESSSQEASKPHRLKRQQPTPCRRESLEGRGAEQQASSCSVDKCSFKAGLYSATASLSMTLLNKTSWSSHLARPQSSAHNLSLRGSDPTLLPKVGDPHVREDSNRVHTASKKDLQPPGLCCAGTESVRGQGEPENPNGAPQNPPGSKKFGFMRHLRSFLLRLCFRK